MAAGSTYTPIATTTLGSSQSSVTFNSFSGYTDLILIINGLHSSSVNDGYGLQFNSDTGTNYSTTYLLGSGSAASSGRVTNQTRALCGWLSTDIGTYINHIQNYSNTTTYKPIVSRGSQTNTNTYLNANVSLWRSTSAITSILVKPDSGTFSAGMTLTIYGITAA